MMMSEIFPKKFVYFEFYNENDDDDEDNVDDNDGAHPLHLLLDGGHGEGGLCHLGRLDSPPECHQ